MALTKNEQRVAEVFELLFIAWDYCDEEDKSTEFMLQYMADFANVDYDDVVEFISDPDVQKLREMRFKENSKN